MSRQPHHVLFRGQVDGGSVWPELHVVNGNMAAGGERPHDLDEAVFSRPRIVGQLLDLALPGRDKDQVQVVLMLGLFGVHHNMS